METSLLAEIKALCLLDPRWTVSAAESLTSGQVQTLIGSISGASQFFAGGMTAYSIDQKVELLGVNRDRAAQVDCVSEEIAEQMAVGVARRFKTTWSIATTGYAEPSADKNVVAPFAWWAIAFTPKIGASDASVPLRTDPRGSSSGQKKTHPVGGRWLVRTGRVEYSAKVKRLDVQRRVATAVLEELLAAMRAERAK